MDPGSVAHVLSQGFRLYVRAFVPLALAVLAVVVPMEVVYTALERIGPGGGDAARAGWAALLGGIDLLGISLATGAAFGVAIDAKAGRAPSARRSVGAALRRAHSLVWVSLLGLVLTVIGFVLLVVPGVYLLVALSVAAPVVLAEGLRGSEALLRSRELVTGRWWPAFWVLLVAAAASSLVGLGLLAALRAIPDGGSFVVDVLVGAAGGVLGFATTPFLCAVTAVLYLDLRAREGGQPREGTSL